jgi:hypothetical protein
MRNHLTLSVLLSITVWCASSRLCLAKPAAPLSPRRGVEQAYEKSSTATSFRFLDGMYSVRALKFTAFGPHGKPVDLRHEREAMARILANSLSATEKVDITSFKQINASHVECLVHDMTQFLMTEPGTEKRRIVTLDTTSRDRWALVEGRWRQQQTNVVHQTSTSKDLTPPGATPTPTPASPTPKK